MTEQRKASDIILDLEVKMNTLLQSIGLYNLNLKLILDRTNYIYKYIEKLETEIQQNNVSSGVPEEISDPKIIQINADHNVLIEENQIGQRRTTRPETYATESRVVQQSSKPAQSKIKQETNSQVDKKVPITQRITDNKGKDLFMAEVHITNEQKETVAKIKTNAAGKWQALIRPGNYSVHVIKTDTTTKEKIEAIQQIVVPNSDATVVLPVAIIKRPTNET